MADEPTPAMTAKAKRKPKSHPTPIALMSISPTGDVTVKYFGPQAEFLKLVDLPQLVREAIERTKKQLLAAGPQTITKPDGKPKRTRRSKATTDDSARDVQRDAAWLDWL